MNKTIEELAKQFTDELFAGDDLTDFDTQTAKDDAYVRCMVFGNHLMEQPLASRMTKEEKERVREMYSEAQGWLDEEPTSDSYNSCLRICAVTIQDRLESIFGKELFK